MYPVRRPGYARGRATEGASVSTDAQVRYEDRLGLRVKDRDGSDWSGRLVR